MEEEKTMSKSLETTLVVGFVLIIMVAGAWISWRGLT